MTGITRAEVRDMHRREMAEEIAAWLQHIDRLDEIPGAHIGLPHCNPLWDAAEAIREKFA